MPPPSLLPQPPSPPWAVAIIMSGIATAGGILATLLTYLSNVRESHNRAQQTQAQIEVERYRTDQDADLRNRTLSIELMDQMRAELRRVTETHDHDVAELRGMIDTLTEQLEEKDRRLGEQAKAYAELLAVNAELTLQRDEAQRKGDEVRALYDGLAAEMVTMRAEMAEMHTQIEEYAALLGAKGSG